MANQRKAVQPERLLYPVYSVKMAGYADTAAGAFELQEELLAEDDSGTFVIGRAIDASEKIGETKPLTDVWTEAEIAAKRDAAVRDAVDAAFDNTAKE
jgi:hypothetical protein